MSWVPAILRPDRYEAILHGMESGTVTSFPFIRFKTEKEADEWTQKMNKTQKQAAPKSAHLTLWDYREIG